MASPNLTKEAATLLEQLLYPENECIDCGTKTKNLIQDLCTSCYSDNFK